MFPIFHSVKLVEDAQAAAPLVECSEAAEAPVQHEVGCCLEVFSERVDVEEACK